MKTFDFWAWVEYFKGSKAGQSVRAMIESEELLATPAVCLAEVRTKYLVEGRDAGERLRFIKERTSVVIVDAAVAEMAADLKVQFKLHMVDALVLACAKSVDSELVTGDEHFRGVPSVAMLP